MADYRHFLAMTDNIGMLQFSILDLPDPLSGYTLDDNARALIIALMMDNADDLIEKYAGYLYGSQQSDGNWANFLLHDQYSSSFDSEDSVGRAILACCLGYNCHAVSNYLGELLQKNLPRALQFNSPRATAYSLLGICKGTIPFSENQKLNMARTLSNKLISSYQKNHDHKWFWFENYLTYCNGIMPHALFSAYKFIGDKKILKTAHESLRFLNSILFRKGYLNIIGNTQWYHRHGKISLFDQQPVDAASITLACLEAFTTTGDNEYRELAEMAHRWYRGANIHGLSLYNEATGGCHDALIPQGLNSNQGAEAVLSLLLTDLNMALFNKQNPELVTPI